MVLWYRYGVGDVEVCACSVPVFGKSAVGDYSRCDVCVIFV